MGFLFKFQKNPGGKFRLKSQILHRKKDYHADYDHNISEEYPSR